MNPIQQAALLFDTTAAMGRVGSRGDCEDARTLLFQLPPFSVDVELREGPGDLRVVYGQVIDETGPRAVPQVAVWFGESDERTLTDDFGQFSLSCVGADAARVLWLELDGVATACPLPATDPPPASGEVRS